MTVDHLPLRSPGSGEANRDAGYLAFQGVRRAHWDAVAEAGWHRRGLGGAYHGRLAEVFRLVIPPGLRVLDLGCGQGDLLAALEPAVGVGVDFSGATLDRARERHPNLRFVEGDAHDVDLGETFDVILLFDLINDVWDVQAVLEAVARHATPRTRVVMNCFSLMWKEPLTAARRMGLATPLLPQNWLTREDVTNLLGLVGLETVRDWDEVLLPLNIPVLGGLANRYLVKVPPFSFFALSHIVVARPAPQPIARDNPPRVSVVVAARNEAGHIEDIVARTPDMGAGTELIFVEGHSSDDTYGAIERVMADNPGRDVKLFRQPGKGKGDAVRKGFAEASGDVLMILDADMTVAPEDLPRFYNALVGGKGEFINGVRLV